MEIFHDMKSINFSDKIEAFDSLEYYSLGDEYKYCLNDYEDMQAIIDAHDPVHQKTYKCSVSIFKLKYVETNKNPIPHPSQMLELRIQENSEDRYEVINY